MLTIFPLMNHSHPSELLALMAKTHWNIGASSLGVKTLPDEVKDILTNTLQDRKPSGLNIVQL